jgi:hypothetical protein
MGLHQIQVTYQQDEDRLLLRASFTGAGEPLGEVRAWLTRRLLRNLWPGIVKALETQVTLNQPQAAHAKAEIVGMQHQATVQDIAARGDFKTPYADTAQAFPIGEAPILVTTVHFNISANKPVRIRFEPAQGQGFEVALSPQVLHGFCNLLREAVKTAQWEVELNLPGTGADGAPDPAPRVLN